uniref:Intraflagellar transport protein 122 homolog n=1 Tax=Rhabditophanes sp. KR3021 TaxID=114890 RepID=A0AC35U6Z2_9BILA
MTITIYDVAFRPDGKELLVAADKKVLVYDGDDGTLIDTLKAHKDNVYCVGYSGNGEFSASGGADKAVIIWNKTHQGVIKYNHHDSIQCLAFNPVTTTLITCAMTDFGLWIETEKNVNKYKITSRCCSVSWNSVGTLVAIGMFDGTISIRSIDKGDNITTITRSNHEPVWALKFTLPSLEMDFDVRLRAKGTITPQFFPEECLVVTDFGRTISHYRLDGTQLYPAEKAVDYDVLTMDFITKGNFLVMGGMNKQISLYTREGNDLGVIAILDSYVTAVRIKPNDSRIMLVVACADGGIACYHIMFSVVHGLYKDHYAHRKNMTEVAVELLSQGKATKISCGELVKKVAVYARRLIIQLPDKIHIYHQISGDNPDEPLEYRLSERIVQKFNCSLFVVTELHLILCHEKKLQCYDFKGLKQREWHMEALIRYIKVVGGPSGRESVLIGLKNGHIYKIFIDNPFPILLYQSSQSIRCIDVSMEKTKLVAVDESGTCVGYDFVKKEIVFQEPDGFSVVCNSKSENLFCYSSNDAIYVKTCNFTAFSEPMKGFVCGFNGRAIFVLCQYIMSKIEIALTNHLYQLIHVGRFEDAFEMAILGVPESDWIILGHDAMESYNFEVAKNAFARLRDYKSLLLIHEMEQMIEMGQNKKGILGFLYAYSGNFAEAATVFQEYGMEEMALDMFSDLRMFDLAQEFLSKATPDLNKALLRRKAEWAKESNNNAMAAQMLVDSGDLEGAINVMIENDWADMVISTWRKIDKSDGELLRTIAEYLIKKNEYTLATTIYTVINDIVAIMEMHVEAGHWEDAFALARQYPHFSKYVYLPYARYLAEENKFEECQEAFHKAGHEQEAFDVLESLSKNALQEKRYSDCSYYNWKLAIHFLDRSLGDEKYLEKYHKHQYLADSYYAYNFIHQNARQPFTATTDFRIFMIARYLCILPKPPPKISMASVYFTICQLARKFHTYKTSRQIMDKLQDMVLTADMKQFLQFESINIRVKPYSDHENMLLVCYRCSQNNPILGSNHCNRCNTEFIHSFHSFDQLPLVEIFLEKDITDEEAVALIDQDTSGECVCSQQLQKMAPTKPLNLGREQLRVLETHHVFIQKLPKPLRFRYYVHIFPSIPIIHCETCFKMFIMDDFEEYTLQHSKCPFCRTPIIFQEDVSHN